MKKKLLQFMILFSFLFPCLESFAVTKENFKAITTRDLVNLCSASAQDPYYKEAIHFCEGYLVGAFDFYAAQSKNNPKLVMVCFPEPMPSRDQTVEMFVAWAQEHQQYMTEMPVESEFRFLTEKWPCKK